MTIIGTILGSLAAGPAILWQLWWFSPPAALAVAGGAGAVLVGLRRAGSLS